MSEADRHILIVGAGQAGLQAAETLRNNGFAGKITVHGEEPYLPYHRPPLSKTWLTREIDERQLTIRDKSFFDRKGIRLEINSNVEQINPDSRTAELSCGRSISWTGLVLATGARPRGLPDTHGSAAVHVLRSRDNAVAVAQRLQECLQARRSVVVIGGGFIGLEVAASARKLGLAVTIVEAAARLLERVLCPTLSAWYADLHQSRGSDVITDAKVSAIEPLGTDAARVRLLDGRHFDAGLVVVGIGVEPNDELARMAGIACDRGIVVDGCGRTSMPDIVAAGDCTVRRLDDGSAIRLESVQNALEQGRSAALALLGIERPLRETPWFWSDQYDIKLQIAGLARGTDTSVLRGDLGQKSFSMFHYKEQRLIAVDSINSAKDHMLSRQLIGADISPTPDQAKDTSFNLASLKPRSQ